MTTRKQHSARRIVRGFSSAVADLRALYRPSATAATFNVRRLPTLPRDWRNRLPDPSHYYSERVVKLGRQNANGWAQGKCPFHEDRDASFSVNLTSPRGCWKCFAGCGAGDMVSFHERLTGQPFKEAVAQLLRGGQ